jgi:NTE family protein
VIDEEEPGKQGFVLSGGGAYAAYEIGVMRALISGSSPATNFTPADPQVLAGTSGGSINAAITASAVWAGGAAAVQYLEDVWVRRIAEAPGACTSNVLRLRANPLSVVNPACFADGAFYAGLLEDVEFLADQTQARGAMVLQSPGTLRQRLLEAFDLGMFISGNPLRGVLRDIIDFDRVRCSPCAMRIAATNWRTGELRVFRNEDMTETQGVDILVGSSAIPGVFASVDVAGEPYVDGGVVMNTPLRPAIQAGANELHVIYMDPDVWRIPLPRLRNTLNTLYRMLVISFGLTVSRDIHTAAAINRRLRASPAEAETTVVTGVPRAKRYRPLTIHRYHPTEDLGGTFRWLDFDRDHVVRLIERGYEDTCVHDCKAMRCVIEGQDDPVSAADTAEWVRRDA